MSGWEIGGLTLLASLAVLLLAGAMLVRAARLRRDSGLPAGSVLYTDTRTGARGTALYSESFGLAGAPDYVVETPEGPVPVELKPGRTEGEPHDSHLLQVLAYCLLLEETAGQAPPYGLLRYSRDTFKVDYNPGTRAYLLDVLAAMRRAEGEADVHRSHERPGRCRGCGYRTVCDESLWAEPGD